MLTYSLYAQDFSDLPPPPPTSTSIGLGAEISSNSREGVAAGGVLSFGIDLNQQFALGLKASFSLDADSVSTLEPRVFARYYLPLKITGLFAQAELGAALIFEDSKLYPAFSGGIAAGWRYYLYKNLYIEPAVRAGYPFIWGLSLTAGWRFNGESQ